MGAGVRHRRGTANALAVLALAALALTLAGLTAAAAPAQAASPPLNAGVGKADIQPQTGYYLGGWTRADRTAQGQHTRLQSRALVLESGGRKVALVQVDLFMVPGGMVQQIGERLAARGFSEQNILISASHTHSGPGGYANFPTLNTAAPSLETAADPSSFAGLLAPGPADPQLYTFLLGQIETAIRRADDDLGPAVAGWGSGTLLGLTRNRSLEAHLNNHGIQREYGQGTESEDPGGYRHTVDPDVSVLRIDKVVRRGRKRVRMPIGGWSTFANHGTVTKSSFEYYNADHHASAMRVFERRIRDAKNVPPGQEILNVYGTSNEGDMSAGLDRNGPAASDFVGRMEADSMIEAWRRAGNALKRRPRVDLRWTRICFCGQEVDGAGGYTVAAESEVGIPFLTGSEEERGPLFDITGEHFEGRRGPDRGPPHGQKISAPTGGVPNGIPLTTLRVGPRLIASVPGEGTKEVGARIEAAVGAAVAGSGIEEVVISGLANEFILYLTTPEEYDRQHYEGGNTHFGRLSSVLVQQGLARLAGTLARGEPGPEPYPFDPTNGVTPNGPPFPSGAADGTITEQPGPAYGRLGHATLSWTGGPRGLDRPVDRAFVTAQRRVGRRWVDQDSDLGLAMLWTVDDAGNYTVKWEVPLAAPRGTYRLRVTAKRYQLASRPFQVNGTGDLEVIEAPAPPGSVAVRLQYPGAIRDVDLTFRPQFSRGGSVRFRVGGRTVRVRRSRLDTRAFTVRVPTGASVSVPRAAGRDRFGNVNGEGLQLR